LLKRQEFLELYYEFRESDRCHLDVIGLKLLNMTTYVPR